MKLTIIGYSGGGKTTLAKKIAAEFNIPHQQIDRIWFEAGGHKVQSEAESEAVRNIIETKVTEFAKQDSWVSDGFYSRAQGIIADTADRVVVIELPLLRRLYNHWKRILKKDGRHPEITTLHDFLHSFEIIKRTFTFKQRLETFKVKYHEKVVVLRSFKEIDVFFENLKQSRKP
jgi:adenylate kinase family enzyme